MTLRIPGQCHCGNVSFEIHTKVAVSDIAPRACACRFCRIHAAKNWSDPDGKVTIAVRNEHLLQKYLFALRTAEFYICKECGAYIGAVLSDIDGTWSTVNLRLTHLHDLHESPVDFGAEQVDERISRRKRVWTPTEATVPA